MTDSLILPKPMQEEVETPVRSRFVIEPLYPGYGTTLGNAVRRILLSSLPGCAVNAISIEGVQHEFSSLDDVKEDVVDIMLNVKKVRFRMDGEHEEPVKVEIDAQGSGPVKASAFVTPTGVACVTPDAHIATLTAAKARLHLFALLTRGRGFLAVEAREKEKLPIGTIAMDALYAPVRHVAFTLDHVPVGQMTNYDKVVLVVETDGSLTPREAMAEALSLLRPQVAGLTLDDGIPAADAQAAPVDAPAGEDRTAAEEHEAPTPHAQEEEKAPSKKKGKKKKEDG